jgi:hypothetical protein
MEVGAALIRWVILRSGRIYLFFQNGSWNGGVRDIMDGVADLGGAFFRASFIRSIVVDFTLPMVETINTFFLKNPKVNQCYLKYFTKVPLFL